MRDCLNQIAERIDKFHSNNFKSPDENSSFTTSLLQGFLQNALDPFAADGVYMKLYFLDLLVGTWYLVVGNH